jgi:hypothetical protein
VSGRKRYLRERIVSGPDSLSQASAGAPTRRWRTKRFWRRENALSPDFGMSGVPFLLNQDCRHHSRRSSIKVTLARLRDWLASARQPA